MNNGMFKMEDGYDPLQMRVTKTPNETAEEIARIEAALFKTAKEGFWYLGSPYSKYPAGRLQAYIDIQKMMALCIANGLVVYCPIVHSHYVLFDDLLIDRKEDYDLWLGLDKVFLDASIGLIVTKMEGWDVSHGLTWEIDYMTTAKKPIIYTEWMELPVIDS